MFEKKRIIGLNKASLLAKNEISVINSLVSCHVCIIRIKDCKNEFNIMSHFKVTNVTEHITAIQAILNDCKGASAKSFARAVVLIFRLSSAQLVKVSASPGTIYHVNKYEEATRLLKEGLTTMFNRIDLQEIPYGSIGNKGCWVKFYIRKGNWESSFDCGLIEEASGRKCSRKVLLRQVGH